MDNIQKDISEYLSGKSAQFVALGRDEAIKWERNIRFAFAEPLSSAPLWESIKNERGCFNDSEIGAVLKSSIPVSSADSLLVLLIADWHGYSSLIIRGVDALSEALGEMYNFVWYVTNEECEFLICRNDHGVVLRASKSDGN